ncbi:MAG TPA: metallophosphoesterase [Sphingorhabdus sp.]|nr:metallophosphoesterase [Sphingorhabdus sp.]
MIGTKARTKGRWLRWILALLLLLLALLGKGYWNATRDPIVHRATLSVKNWPAGEPPLKVLLLSDTHVAGPDMPPERLARIVADLNRLKPDLVLIAGDLISEKRLSTRIYTPDQVTAPLHGFKARLGTVVALGNHDHWFDPTAIEVGLRKGGITVLKNEAIERGPLVIGGGGGDFSGQDGVPAALSAMDPLTAQPRVLVTPSPDIVPDMPSSVAAVFAGHTHCGQIVLPLYGPVTYVSRYGDRFGCGAIEDKGQPVFVGAGLGTSVLPLRYGAHPDVWLVTLKP